MGRLEKDKWDKAHIIIQGGIAIIGVVIALIGACFTYTFSVRQSKIGEATLELAKSNSRAAKQQIIAAIVPSLSSSDPKQRSIALALAENVDQEFSLRVASIYALKDPDKNVRKSASEVLISLSKSTVSAISQPAERSLGQYSLISELRDKGLLERIFAVKEKLDINRTDDQITAVKIYREIIDKLSQAGREKLDQRILSDAEDNYRKGLYKEALDKYQSLFNFDTSPPSAPTGLGTGLYGVAPYGK